MIENSLFFASLLAGVFARTSPQPPDWMCLALSSALSTCHFISQSCTRDWLSGWTLECLVTQTSGREPGESATTNDIENGHVHTVLKSLQNFYYMIPSWPWNWITQSTSEEFQCQNVLVNTTWLSAFPNSYWQHMVPHFNMIHFNMHKICLSQVPEAPLDKVPRGDATEKDLWFVSRCGQAQENWDTAESAAMPHHFFAVMATWF